jgi:hypothetical protein
MRLMGQAFVTWGEVETLWRMMLPVLLFEGFKHPQEDAQRKIGGRADDELSLAEERAYALWDSLLNSAAQLNLVLKVAPLALTDPNQAKGLAKLLAVGKATNNLRAKRNAIAHSAFERSMRWEGGLDPRTMTAVEEIVRPARHAHMEIRGQNLEVAIPQILEDFRRHLEHVRDVWTWLRIGIPADAGAPLPGKHQERSKARGANPGGSGRKGMNS